MKGLALLITGAAILTGCGSGAQPPNHLHAALQRANSQTRLAQHETAAVKAELTDCEATTVRLEAEVAQLQTHATELEAQVQQLESEVQEAAVDVEDAETTTSVSKLLTFGFCAVLAVAIVLLAREIARRREKAAQ